MALFRTLNALRRETLGLALQTLGLKPHSARIHKAGPTLYRTYKDTPTRRVATQLPPMIVPAELMVRALVRETADAVSIVLARADGQPIAFKAGMFYTVIVVIDGQEHRRGYSLSSAAHENRSVSITVKRVDKGLVSNWLNDNLMVGSTLRVLGPSGNFVVTPNPAHARTLLLVGGGSGITPLMSITRTVLAMALWPARDFASHCCVSDFYTPNGRQAMKSASIKRMFITALCVIGFVIALMALGIYKLGQAATAVSSANEVRYSSYLLADEMRQSSDDLTRLARTYVVTGDAKWEQQYFEILDIRNGKKPRPAQYEKIYWDFKAADIDPGKGGGATVSLNDLMKQAGFTEAEFGKLKEAEAKSNTLV